MGLPQVHFPNACSRTPGMFQPVSVKKAGKAKCALFAAIAATLE
jgi:hypothetical protein